MTIKRIKDFPEGSSSLSNDDIFLFMDNPAGSGVTKKISLSQIASAIGGGGGSLFDQSLNTTDFPTFNGVSLSNGTTLTKGTFDNNLGGQSGISLNCYVGYELNWQGGHLKSTTDNGVSSSDIYVDSDVILQQTPDPNANTSTTTIEYDQIILDSSCVGNPGNQDSIGPTYNTAISPGSIDFIYGAFNGETWINTTLSVGALGITFPDSTVQSSAGIVSATGNIPGASGISNIVSISQAAYDNLNTKDPTTLYIIT